MKRTILFKGKNAETGKWIEGNLIESNNGDAHILVKNSTPIKKEVSSIGYWYIDSPCYQVNPETVCQSIGLLDKNGNKIFEGDKVKFKNFRGFNGMKISKHDGWIEGFEGVIHWSNQFGWFLNKDNAHNSKILEAKGKETESRKCNLVITNSNICAFETEVIGNIHD